MPAPLIDLSQRDLTGLALTREDIYRILPQRRHFELLHGVVFLDPAAQEIIAYTDFTPEDWWVPGHLPHRPLVPGIVMMEAAAQTASLLMRKVTPGWKERFIGFGGVDGVRFRGAITPPARLWLTAKGGSYRSNLARMPVQGICGETIVFSGHVLGVLL